ncbi:porin family protein [uncultured Fibrobacter sp.]|uniref:porin family protein n=1 Tax=uncultured Fibrobacter sp. TaxID=261512 RepID=UPI00260EFAE1|nr:porin family protein [uncultured Fibrobacter sp.]
MKFVPTSTLFSSILLIGALATSSAFAQGVFEGSGEVSDPNCVGDGCGYIPANEANSSETSSTESNNAVVADSNETQLDSTVATADSIAAKDTAKAVVNIDEEDDDRPNFINENAEEYRARKEGFSRGIQFGIRLGGGISTHFGNGSENWDLGYEGTGGLMAQLPLGPSIGVLTELDFTYRHYSYEENEQYGHNEATIDEFLFEIPVMAQYYFDEDGLFVALGMNLGLKMSGESEFKQEIKTDEYKDKDKRPNTLPTVGVEIGGLFDIGYTINRWLIVDIRVIQNFTNLLDQDLIAESALTRTKLYTMHVTAGITLLL